MRTASRDITQIEYFYKPDAKRAAFLEMIMQDFGGEQFQVLAVRYRANDSMLELHAVLLEPDDDVDAEIAAFRGVPGTVLAWVSYKDWPEYADQVR